MGNLSTLYIHKLRTIVLGYIYTAVTGCDANLCRHTQASVNLANSFCGIAKMQWHILQWELAPSVFTQGSGQVCAAPTKCTLPQLHCSRTQTSKIKASSGMSIWAEITLGDSKRDMHLLLRNKIKVQQRKFSLYISICITLQIARQWNELPWEVMKCYQWPYLRLDLTLIHPSAIIKSVLPGRGDMDLNDSRILSKAISERLCISI